MTTTPATAVRTAPAPAGARGGGNALAGTGALIRFILRRDRVRIPVWIGALTLASLGTVNSFQTTYASPTDRANAAGLVDSPAMIAMVGRNYSTGEYTYGAMMAQQMLAFTAIFVALMSVLLLVRHTRTDEEAGRAELVRATVVGRHAHLTAAVIVIGATNLVLGGLTAVGLASMNVPSIDWEGSLLYGAALAVVGLAFTGVAAVTAQVTEHGRGAAGMAGALIGLAYVLRAAGDVGDGTLSWLSPIGWAQGTEVFVNNYWWPLSIAVVFGVVAVGAAFALSTRRDVGAGLRAARPGRAEASSTLTRPLGLALRLHRGSLIGWSVGMLLLGASYGSVIGEIETFAEDNQFMRDMFAGTGASFTDSFLGTITAVLAMACGIMVILAVQRLRSEETAGRAEPLLATAIARARWMASHLFIALVGGAWILLLGALGLALSAAATTGDGGLIGELMIAGLAYVPALWVVAGVSVALFGLLPRWTALGWVVVIYSFVVVYFGQILQFPDWLSNLSPFGHVPQLTIEDFNAVPLLILTAVAVALIGAGLAGLRRRDIYST